MTDGAEAGERDPLDLLSEQFLQRHRAGEPVSVESFVAEHPEQAAGLRDLLPMLLALEQAKRDRASSGSSARRAMVPKLERLGDFRIVAELGRGGMGVVFEAVQESLGRKVALKVLPQSALLTGNQLERFQREAQIAARLHHSNIVPVFGSGESDGYHWYAMQFIVGRSLDRWREEQKEPLPIGSGAWLNRGRFVARLGVQAASALHYAHGLGTLHRDIKPANLLLEQNDHLWVTDFGLAKALEAEGLTHTGDLLGTLQYMAPEQFAGQYDVRSEVYALGVTLYELLTLRPAFQGGSRSELMERIRAHQPVPLRRACPDVDEDLCIVVEKAMARDAADRYRDAEALRADLQAFLEGRPIQARRLSPLLQTMRWCARNRGFATALAVALLAVVAAAVTGWVAQGTTQRALEQESAALARATAAAASERTAATLAASESERAKYNLRLALAGLAEAFDAIVGRDPWFDVAAVDSEDEDLAAPGVDPATAEQLQRFLRFYDQFAAQNAGDQSLRLETARAHRRVGAIHVRLGTPEDFAKARASYEQALTVARACDKAGQLEVAATLLDLSRLERRQRNVLAVARCLHEALDLLVAQPDSVQVRFERAVAHCQLAQLADPEEGGRPGGGPSASQGGPPGRDHVRLLDGAHQHLQQALALAEGLRATDADHREFIALHARVLLLSSHLPEPGREAPRGPERERSEKQLLARAQALELLGAAVQRLPHAEDLRFELADALLGRRRDARRDESGPRGSVGPDLATWRTAQEHAKVLLQARPQSTDYQDLMLRCAVQIARGLREQADAATGADRETLRRAAIRELEAVAKLADELVATDQVLPVHTLPTLFDHRRLLISLYLLDRRRDDAITQLQLHVQSFERVVAQLDRGQRPRLPRFLRMGELRPELDRLDEVLRNLGQEALLTRLRALRTALTNLEERAPTERRRPG